MRRSVSASSFLLTLLVVASAASAEPIALRADRMLDVDSGRILSNATVIVGAQQYSEEEMQAVVEEAARHDIKVAAHAHGTEGINAAIRAGVASIEHGSLIDEESIQMMKERGTYLVLTAALADIMQVDGLPTPVRDKTESVMTLATP